MPDVVGIWRHPEARKKLTVNYLNGRGEDD